jgi:hypothetical protein
MERMSSNETRRRIAREAARLMQCCDEPAFYRARLKAARRVLGGEPQPQELPSQAEIRRQVHDVSRRMHREPADAEPSPPSNAPADDTQRAGADEDQRMLAFRLMLLALEPVEQSAESHPEGDALYHSLQVFQLARDAQPYDEEFLLAALLHDVGKAVDRREHTVASLEMLAGLITPRTAWLIEHHPAAHALRDGTLGARSRRRLAASPDFDDLKLLAECDAAGRQPGMPVPEVDQALDYLRRLAAECDDPHHRPG